MSEKEIFLPGATIGVMGGGQLGRMFSFAARRMGYRVHIFSPEEKGPAAEVADFSTVGNYADETLVRQFARAVDLVTFEFENIPARCIEWAAEHTLVRPRGEVLHIAQNRLREKTFLADAGFPVAPFRPVENVSQLTNVLRELGAPAILKTAAFGYDGKGQERIDDLATAETMAGGREYEECILEKVVAFEREISVIVARNAARESAVFPVCENIHRAHILDLTLAPARVSERVADEARELARAVAEKLDLVGLLAVEMFLAPNDELLINELAPRPHNSGHWTIEGCLTSQFEQHVRAVCGLSLGATDLLRAAAMANLLGDVWYDGEPNWAAALGEPTVHLHLYGKHSPRPKRKMGHLTALAATLDEASATVLRAREKLSENKMLAALPSVSATNP